MISSVLKKEFDEVDSIGDEMGIAVGNKIELVRLDQVIRNEQNKRVYVSKIFDFLEDDTLQIAMPIYEGKIVPLDLNENYTACFYTDRGLLQCNVMVTSRYRNGNLFFLDVKMLGKLEKVQRRQFYRYDCLIEAKIRIVSDYEYDTGIPEDISIPEDELPWEPARIIDISGGGVRVNQRNHIDRNEVVKVKFMIPFLNEILSFNLFARILASTRIQGRADMYEQRMEFLKISQDERDKIVRFIFESERAKLAGGKR